MRWFLGILLSTAASMDAAPPTPKRIVALAPSSAEIAAALGLGDAIVGVTNYTDWPPRTKNLPQVGSYVNIDVEAVVALRPDLVLATDDGNPPTTLRRLERLGLRVVTLRLRDFDSIQQSILSLGRMVGREDEGRRAVAKMKRVATCVSERTRTVARPRVLFAYQLGPIVSAGKGTFTNQLLAMAGADSITKDVEQSYPHLSVESVVTRAPEVIVVSSMNPAADANRADTWLKKWPAMPAVRNRRVHLIDSTNLDRPSQRVVHGLALLARTIHPTLFARGECAPDLP
ncbi:MAG TPA: helical backbone metal receptor [Thermoanaerobaculia bacterium]|nr:helical backbone metal receptor [Thermoanaerobaculia bacterium]